MGRLRQITAQRFFGRLVIREYRNDERKEFGLIFFFLFSSQILLAEGKRDFCPYLFLIRSVMPLVYDGYFLSGKANLIVMRG